MSEYGEQYELTRGRTDATHRQKRTAAINYYCGHGRQLRPRRSSTGVNARRHSVCRATVPCKRIGSVYLYTNTKILWYACA